MGSKLKNRRFRKGSYLTSDDVIRLTGVSRRMLSTVEKNGLCTPHRNNEYGGVLGWTPEQARLVEQIDLLRNDGVSFDKIKKLLYSDQDSVDSLAANASVELIRNARRALKRNILRQYYLEDFSKCGTRDGYYLRYIPQRYFAIIPQSYGSLMDPKSRMRATVALMDVVDHVGWARAESIGGILGAPQPYEAACFACIELASMPMPSAAESDDFDSGCYHTYEGPCALGAEDSCAHCARFGNAIDTSEELLFAQIDSAPFEQPINIMVDDLDRPYPCGPWSSFTARHLQKNGKAAEGLSEQDGKNAAHAHSDDAPELSPAARPRLMPQLVDLPLGVTACVLPASYYLCRQCQDGTQMQFLSEMIGTTHVIPQKERTLDVERAISTQLAAIMKATRGGSFGSLPSRNPDLCASVNPIGDPAQRGQCRGVDYSELVSLTIPSAMGLTPESDFPLTWTTIPSSDVNASPLFELQVPVATGDIELGKSSRRKSREVLGIVASPPMQTEKAKPLDTFRCRLCGTGLQPDEDKSVLVCETCGNAQPQMRMTSDRRMLLLQQAEERRAQGDFDGAGLDCSLACKLDPNDPEAHWLLMLCRYGVSYRKDPATGRYVPCVSRPGETPIEHDEDCAAALALADDAQWLIYRRQLHALETARTQTLEDV